MDFKYKNFIILLLITIVLIFTGCASIQERYAENNTRSSIVKEYTLTKNTYNSWNILKTKSFPAFKFCFSSDMGGGPLYFILPIFPMYDLALLPFQTLYDGIFSYDSKYEAHLIISGQLVNEAEAPIVNRNFKVSVLDREYNIYTNSQGYFTNSIPNLTESVREITCNFADINQEDLDNFYKGVQVAQVMPFAVKYNVEITNSIGDIKRQDLITKVKDNGTREILIDEWDEPASLGDVITLKRVILSSEKNLTVQKQEEAVAEAKRLEIEKENEKQREIEEAKEKARIKAEKIAEEKRKKEEAKWYILRSPEEADKEWLNFRNNEDASKGAVTTWRMRFENSDFMDSGIVGQWHDKNCFLEDNFKRKVVISGYEGGDDVWDNAGNIVRNDWVIVTGRLKFINKDGSIQLQPIKVKRIGYKD